MLLQHDLWCSHCLTISLYDTPKWLTVASFSLRSSFHCLPFPPKFRPNFAQPNGMRGGSCGVAGERSHGAWPAAGEAHSEARCGEGSRDAAPPEGARREEEALILTEASKAVFRVAACLGLYVVAREGENCYRISKLKIIPAAISFVAALSSLLHAILLMFFTEMTYDQEILFLPLFSGSCFCFYIYILWMRKSHWIMDYMTQLEVHAIKIPKRENMPFVIAGVFIYSASYAAAAAVALPVPSFISSGSLRYLLFIPVFFTAFIPSFADIWVFSFLHPLVVALQGLTRRARDVKVWTKEVSASVMKEWLLLHRLLEIYNEVWRRDRMGRCRLRRRDASLA